MLGLEPLSKYFACLGDDNECTGVYLFDFAPQSIGFTPFADGYNYLSIFVCISSLAFVYGCAVMHVLNDEGIDLIRFCSYDSK